MTTDATYLVKIQQHDTDGSGPQVRHNIYIALGLLDFYGMTGQNHVPFFLKKAPQYLFLIDSDVQPLQTTSLLGWPLCFILAMVPQMHLNNSKPFLATLQLSLNQMPLLTKYDCQMFQELPLEQAKVRGRVELDLALTPTMCTTDLQSNENLNSLDLTEN